MAPLCSYYDNLDNSLGEMQSLSWASRLYSLPHYLHCSVSLTQLQLFQLKHKPVAIEMMYCIEIGHVRAFFRAPIKRRSRAADWRRWTGSVHLPEGFSVRLENGLKIEWDHSMAPACSKLPLVVWCVLSLTAELNRRRAELCLCTPPISPSDPEQDFTKAFWLAKKLHGSVSPESWLRWCSSPE